MELLKHTFVLETERFESHSMAAEPEGYSHLQYHKESLDDPMISGTIQYSPAVLPTRDRDAGSQYVLKMSFFDASQDLSETIEERQSAVELRADFMGIRSSESDSAWFVFRDVGSKDYHSRKGIMHIYPGTLPEGKSMDFLDWSREFQLGPMEEIDVEHNRWPGGIPYESYYMTLEFEYAPGALDEPPREESE